MSFESNDGWFLSAQRVVDRIAALCRARGFTTDAQLTAEINQRFGDDTIDAITSLADAKVVMKGQAALIRALVNEAINKR